MTEHRTTDTDELAPHPDMTSNDLRDFETWADDNDNRYLESNLARCGYVLCVVFWILLFAVI